MDALASTKALRTDDDQWPLFLKAGIQSRKDTMSLTPIIQNQASLFQLTKDEVFELVLTYKFPQQRVDNSSQCRVDIKLGENIKALGGSFGSATSSTRSTVVDLVV